jgi:hypothetical protein
MDYVLAHATMLGCVLQHSHHPHLSVACDTQLATGCHLSCATICNTTEPHSSPAGQAPRMFDAIAGTQVKRVKGQLMLVIHRPEDLVALLQAYVTLRHNSVVIPELLNSTTRQVRVWGAGGNGVRGTPCQVTRKGGRLGAHHVMPWGNRVGVCIITHLSKPCFAPSCLCVLLLPHLPGLQAISEAASIHLNSAASAGTAREEGTTGSPPAAWTPSLVAQLLASYGRLGYAAPQLLVTALLPVMVPHLAAAAAGDVVLLLEQLGSCQYRITPWVSSVSCRTSCSSTTW